jgi:hypothetical protein
VKQVGKSGAIKKGDAISFSKALKGKAIYVALIFMAICLTVTGCKTAGEDKTGATMSDTTIEEVIKEHAKELMSLPGVVGVGEGLCGNNPCIKVMVIERTPKLNNEIPDVLNGYKVIIEVTGEIRANPGK